MRSLAVFVLILAVGGCRVQCKECPTATKQHLTRCDLFYKCLVLPANGQVVWIPSKCDRGLVYEAALELCVLPADDWECALGDPNPEPISHANDQSNVFVHNDLLQTLQHKIDRYQPTFYDSADNLQATPAGGVDDDVAPDQSDNVEVIEDFARPQGNGNEREDDDVEASGDGGEEEIDNPETHQQQQSKQQSTYIPVPAAPSVATHLQRLTQLIQSMAKAQQQQQQLTNQSRPAAELGPNDLNAFLAHHDIQSGVRHQLLDTPDYTPHPMASDGRIPAAHQAEILRLQQLIQRQQQLQQIVPDVRDRRPTAATATTETPIRWPLASGHGGSPPQIIVNRPGGSVLFSLPTAANRPTGQPQQLNAISDDTLKSMLELSKQLLSQSAANQYLRPVYYDNRPAQQPQLDYPQTYGQQPSASVPSNFDDRSTVIHNHIPITIQQRKPTKPGPAATAIETRYDSFGNKIVTQFPAGQQHLPEVAYPPIYDQLASKTEQSLAFADAYPDYSYYPVTPHLSEQNINSQVPVNTPAYPTLRPTAPATYIRQQQQQPPQYDPDRMYTTLRRPATTSQISDAISAAFQQQSQHSVDPDSHSQLYVDDDDDSDTAESAAAVDQAENEAANVMHPLPPRTIVARPNFSANQFDKPSPSASAATDSGHKHTIVHYGDTYMPYAEYAQNVAPLLSTAGRDRVEMIACVTGARQPSRADCAKYYVCHAGTGKVMTYVCPQYTAFNRQSRFCDARTYDQCKGGGEDGAAAAEVLATVATNRRKEQQQQQQQQQAVAIAAKQPAATRRVMLFEQQQVEVAPVQPTRRRRPRPTANSNRRTVLRTTTEPATTTTSTTTPAPLPPLPAPTKRQPKPANKPMKRRIKCTEPTKVRDSLSVFNYFSCFTGADGALKAIKQTCPNGLVFCARTKVCTSRDRCKGQKMR